MTTDTDTTLPGSGGAMPGASHATGSGHVSVCSRVADLPDGALRLMEHVARDNLSLGPAWMAHLECTVFPDHAGIRYHCLHDSHGTVLAVLPLLQERQRLAGTARALGNWYTTLYEPAIAAGVHAAQLVPLLQAVRRQAPGLLASVTLAPMSPDGAAYRLLAAALRQAGFATFDYFCFGNWYLAAPASWELYLASRSATLRSTIKRMKQRLAKDDGTVELITSAAGLERGLAAYQTVYAKSWKHAEPSPDFIPGLVRLCAERQALRLGVVWLRGEAIAAQLWIVVGRRAEIYKVAYDEAFKAYSPGTILTAHLMEHVLARDGVTEVDYLVGDDAYKRHWMGDRRERRGLIAYNLQSLPGLLGGLAEAARRGAKSLLSRLVALKTRASPASAPGNPP